MSLPIYSSQNIRAWDQFTIENEPITSLDLMERAAGLCAKKILATNLFSSVGIFCGTGNNGGDGLVVARILSERGYQTEVFILEISSPTPDFQKNLERLPKSVVIHRLSSANTAFTFSHELCIDAIFGTGLNRSTDGWIGTIIDQINLTHIPVVALDIPSGLFSLDNRTNSMSHVIKAKQTITFQTPKMAFLYHETACYAGEVEIVDIGLSNNFSASAFAHYTLKEDICLKQRDLFAHKGSNGFLSIIAGFEHYAGAAVLATGAALRTGCGYVATHCEPQNRNILQTSHPESLYLADPLNIPDKTTAIAIGPGLGLSEHSSTILKATLLRQIPLVIDADAINLISTQPELLEILPEGTILTPHPRELERLIGSFTHPEEVLEKQVEFSARHGVYVLQKGAYSKITTPEGKIFVNSSGNPGMATAGMGDVLTGIIGSFLAQRYSPLDAIVYGAFLHGYCADRIRRHRGERGILASDIVEELTYALNYL